MVAPEPAPTLPSAVTVPTGSGPIAVRADKRRSGSARESGIGLIVARWRKASEGEALAWIKAVRHGDMYRHGELLLVGVFEAHDVAAAEGTRRS